MALTAVKSKVKVGFGKKEDKVEKTYARLQLAQTVSLDELAENINDKTGIPVATAKSVLEYLPEAIAQFIRLGHGVDLGFGILKPSISTGAYDDPTKVEVKKKRFTFRIKSKLRDILDRLSINITGDEDTDIDDGTTPSGGGSSDQGGGQQGGGDDDTLQP
jgi:nucleoid DNA-binding protein